jgi:hypothetical protein
MSLSDPLAAGVVADLHKPGLSGIWIRLPRRGLIYTRYFIKAAAGNSPDVVTRLVADRPTQLWKYQIRSPPKLW